MLTLNGPFAIVAPHTVTHTTYMRLKTLLCLSALSVGTIAAVAQSNVYSLNVVGYYNLTVPATQYKLLGNQLTGTNYTLPFLFPNVPANTTVLKWTGVAFAPNTKDPVFDWDDPNMTLGPGEGAFIKNNGSTNFTVTFVGEVNQLTNTTAYTANVYKLSSLFTPQAGLISTDFGFPAAANDTVIKWTGAAYAPSTFDPLFGWDPEPQLIVGDGFFVRTATTKNWTRSFTVPQ